MRKKLLITVSDDISCHHGVRFVGSFFGNKSEVSATLFYVASFADIAGREASQGGLDKKASETAQKKGEEALDAACKMLRDKGFPEENIAKKFIFKQFGTVKDIIREARTGSYDAVVLGRRGYMLFESVLATSVTKEMLDRYIDAPLWICKRPEEDRRNVLLCVDGSSASLRMVDHVGHMLRDENEHSVTLFHVDAEEGGDNEGIMKEARKALLEKWASNGRVKSVVVTSSITGVAKAIAEEAENGGYAVVAVGREGVHKGRLKELLIGSRTRKLLESIDKASLWVSS